MTSSGREQKAPEPRFRDEVPEHFVEEHDNPWVEVVEREGRRKMVGVSTLWDREYDQPIMDGTLWWGPVGEFWSLFHASKRFQATQSGRESGAVEDAGSKQSGGGG